MTAIEEVPNPFLERSSVVSFADSERLRYLVEQKDLRAIRYLIKERSGNYYPSPTELLAIQTTAAEGVVQEVLKIQSDATFQNVCVARADKKRKVLSQARAKVKENLFEETCKIPVDKIFDNRKPSPLKTVPQLWVASFAISGVTTNEYSDERRIEIASDVLTAYGKPFIPQYISKAAECAFLISALANDGTTPLLEPGFARELERSGSVENFLVRKASSLIELRKFLEKEEYATEERLIAFNMLLRGDAIKTVEAYLRRQSEPAPLYSAISPTTTTIKVVQYSKSDEEIAKLIKMRRDFAPEISDESRNNRALRAARCLVHLITEDGEANEDKLDHLRSFVSDPETRINDDHLARLFSERLKKIEQPLAGQKVFRTIPKETKKKGPGSKKKQ